MQVPNVLALSLDEAVKRLEEAGVAYEVKVVLPDDKLVLTIVYR